MNGNAFPFSYSAILLFLALPLQKKSWFHVLHSAILRNLKVTFITLF